MKEKETFKTIPTDQPFNYPKGERKRLREAKRGWNFKFCPEWALPQKPKTSDKGRKKENLKKPK